MADNNQSKLPPECGIIQKMHEVRFTDVEHRIGELRDNYSKSFDAIIDIREAIVRLTVLQETQQKSIAQDRETLATTVTRQNENISQHNAILERSMTAQTKLLEKVLTSRSEEDASAATTKGELTGKKIIAIAGIVSTIVTALGAVIISMIN